MGLPKSSSQFSRVKTNQMSKWKECEGEAAWEAVARETELCGTHGRSGEWKCRDN